MSTTRIYGSEQITNQSIEKEQLNANVAGIGLAKAAEADALSVKVSGATLNFAGVGGVDGLKVATDGITANEIADNAVGNAQLADNAVGAAELDETGSYTIAGLSMLGGNATPHAITGVADGSNPYDAVNKNQLDAVSSGIVWKAPVKYIGDHDAHNGWVLVVGNLVIDSIDNKVYTVTAGSGDGDEVTWNAGVVPTNNEARFVSSTDAAYTYDGDTTTWIQFTGAGQINAGTGLSKSANTINANVGDGLEVNGADPNDMIRVKLDGTTLARSGNGMKVATDGITNVELKDQDSYSMIGLTLTGSITDPVSAKYVKVSTAGVVNYVTQIPFSEVAVTASNGVQLVVNDIRLDLADTNPSLEIADGGVRVKVDNTSIERTANGIAVRAGGITEAMLAASVELGFEHTRVAPNEAPNSIRTSFTFSFQAQLGTELVFLNGVLQQGVAGDGVGIVDDYEIASDVTPITTIYFARAPKTGSRILLVCRDVAEA